MSVFELLNKVVQVKVPISLNELKKGKKYKVINIRRVSTTFGEKVVLELETNIVFLGARSNQLTDEDIEEGIQQAKAGKLYVVSKRKVGKVVDLEFGSL